MPVVTQGELSARGYRFAVIVSRYNDFITERLHAAALEALIQNGAQEQDIFVFRVPGSFEIPQLARKIAEQKRYDAIICLGALIRGQTIHFQLISEECARGIQQVAADFGIPVAFGVVTAETTAQAIERAGEKSQNKGWEAALAAIEMINLYGELKAGSNT